MTNEWIRVYYVTDREGGSLRNSNSLNYHKEEDNVRKSYEEFTNSFKKFVEARRNQTLSGDSELEATLEIKLLAI